MTDGREQVQITVTEKTFQRNSPAWKPESSYSVQRYIHHPSGQLTLMLDKSYRWDFDCRRKWRDAKGHLVEEYLEDVLSSIRQTLEARRQERIRSEKERVLRLQREKIRAEELRQIREEEQRFEELKGFADRWKQCEQIRAFLAAWERSIEAFNGPILSGTPEDGWRRWVSAMVDRLDPLIPLDVPFRGTIERR